MCVCVYTFIPYDLFVLLHRPEDEVSLVPHALVIADPHLSVWNRFPRLSTSKQLFMPKVMVK